MARDVRAALGTTDVEPPIDIESADVVNVTCDGALVRRVMENLVSNGLEVLAGGHPGTHFHRERQRPRACRGARPGARGARGRQGEDLREVRHSRGSTGLDLQVLWIGSRLLQTRDRGPRRDNRRHPGVPAGSTFWFELPA